MRLFKNLSKTATYKLQIVTNSAKLLLELTASVGTKIMIIIVRLHDGLQMKQSSEGRNHDDEVVECMIMPKAIFL